MITIDPEKGILTIEKDAMVKQYDLGTPQAFKIISDVWLRSGWDAKYVYSFTWLGRPVIQLPEDMIRIQEVIYRVQPDVIIETGVAHGGSLIFYASLCKAMDRGRVIGIDIEIRPHNRKAIEEHPLYSFITLVEGSSIDPLVVNSISNLVLPGERAIVLLDSCHTKEHVLSELRAYSALINSDSYIVAMDGIMEQLVGAPRSEPDWIWNNPRQAAHTFVEENPNFVIEDPPLIFNEGNVKDRVTYWPSAFIRRVH